jgi:hypothetical protein
MKEITATVSLIFAGIAIIFGLTFLGFELTSYFKPKYTELDNRVFKESQQYNDGMLRDLENLQVEYINADPASKQALRAIVLHRFAVYPEDRLTPSLANFYNQLKAGK